MILQTHSRLLKEHEGRVKAMGKKVMIAQTMTDSE